MMETTAPMADGPAMRPMWTGSPVDEGNTREYGRDMHAKSATTPPPALSEPGPTHQPHYVPQFSSATSLILNRMNNKSQSSNAIPPTASSSMLPEAILDEEVKTARLGPTINTTAGLPLPDQQVPQSSLTFTLPMEKTSGIPFNPGVKRKRNPGAEEVDFTQNTIAFPTPVSTRVTVQTLTYSQENSRTDDERCQKCQRDEPGPQNPIVQCSGCFSSWHKLCISLVKPEEAVFSSNILCEDCVRANRDSAGSQHGLGTHRQQHIDRVRERRLSSLPLGVVPPKPGLVGFRGGTASGIARTEYFYGKKKTELLNILSFCDQLKPQLLVDLLVSVSRKHPDLPMFDSPDWATVVPSASKPKLGSSAHRSRIQNRPRHGHIISTKSRQRVKPATKSIKNSSTIEVGGEGAAPYEEEDTVPSTWPKAGQGLYAKLAPEVEDRLFLADENDEEAFSHFMVDKLGRQIVAPV